MEANEHNIRLFDYSLFSRSKQWGRTLRLEELNPRDLHIAYIHAGTVSSVHQHNKLFNFILCYTGEVDIKFPYDNIETITLTAEKAIEIPPQFTHQFRAKYNSVIVESYYLEPLQSLSYFDIEREVK